MRHEDTTYIIGAHLEANKIEKPVINESLAYFILSEIKNFDEDFSYEGGEYDLGLGWSAKHEERFGGQEGSGEEHWVVYKITDDKGVETFWKIPGWYQSYNGSELELHNVFQVEAVPTTVMVWRRIRK